MWQCIDARREWRQAGFSFLVLTGLCGAFSCLVIWLVAVETDAALLAPLVQPHPWDWQAETWSRLMPLLVALLVVPAVGSLLLGAHTPGHGGLLGFCASLFNLLPFYAEDSGLAGNGLDVPPLLLAAFFAGAVLAFYFGDLGSWLYRRRRQREDCAREILAIRGGRA